MLSHTISKIKVPAWLKENSGLRNAFFVCVALFSLDVLLYFTFIVPATDGLKISHVQYSELKKRRTEAVLFQKQRQQLMGIKSGMPTQKDMPLIVKDLVQKARGLDLAVSSIDYDIPNLGREEVAVLTFSFPIEGRYADVKRFIFEVETSDRPVGIQDVKMESVQGRVKLLMKLVTYVKGRSEQ